MMKPHRPEPTTRTVQPAPPPPNVRQLAVVCQKLVDAGEDLLGEYTNDGPPNRWHNDMQAALDAAAELGITPTEQP